MTMKELTYDSPGNRTARIPVSEIVYQVRPLSPLLVNWFSSCELLSTRS